MKKARKWIGLKEIILVALLSALWIVLSAILMVPFTTNLYLAAFVAPAVALVVSGIIYTLMCAKSPYHGTLLLFCVIEAIYNYFTVGLILVAAVNVLTGVIMELVMLNGGYQSHKRPVIAYMVFAVGWIMAPAVSVLSTMASTTETLLASGFDQAYIDSVFGMYSAGNLILSCMIGILAAIAGYALGYKLLKKHFIPAGAVQGENK